MAESRQPARSERSTSDHAAIADAGTPELYRSNAFRLTGLATDAGARDLARYGERFEMLYRLNGGTDSINPVFPMDPPASRDDVRDSLQRVREPERRLVDEFFWFWPVSWAEAGPDPASTALGRGQVNGAVTYWQGLLSSSTLRGAALHNLAVVGHLRAVEARPNGSATALLAAKGDWKRVYQSWKEVLHEESAWDYMVFRIRGIDDPRVTPEFAREFRKAFPGLLLAVNVVLARRAAERAEGQLAGLHAEIILNSGFPPAIVASSLRRLTDPETARISSLCQTAFETAKTSAELGATAAKRLIEQTKPVLEILGFLSPDGDERGKAAHDEVAEAVLFCLANYANASKDWKTVLPLTEAAERIAASDEVRAKIRDNLETATTNLQYGTCWFCKEHPPEVESTLKIPMHGEVEREQRFLQGTQVRWRKNIVDVPRCSSCASAHASVSQHKTMGWIVGLLGGWIGCVATQDKNGLLALVVFGSITALAVFVGKTFGRGDAPEGMASEVSGRLFPSALELRRLGWEFGEKPSGT